MRAFDACVDFHLVGALEAELESALAGAPLDQEMTVIIRAGGSDCDIGRIYVGAETWDSELQEDDWCVTGSTVASLARQLRQLESA